MVVPEAARDEYDDSMSVREPPGEPADIDLALMRDPAMERRSKMDQGERTVASKEHQFSPLGLRTEFRVLLPPLFLFLVLIVLIGTVFLREIYAAIAVPISASPAVADIMMTLKASARYR